MPDIHEFIAGCKVRIDPHFGMVARYEGKDYEIAPDGPDMVRVVGDDGETVGRMRLDHDTKSFVAV